MLVYESHLVWSLDLGNTDYSIYQSTVCYHWPSCVLVPQWNGTELREPTRSFKIVKYVKYLF